MNSLNDFINLLEQKGELIRIKAFVDPVLEITEVADRIMKSDDGGKALLFENTGTGFSLLINAFGSEKRMSYALNSDDLSLVSNQVTGLVKKMISGSTGLSGKIKLLPGILKMAGFLPTKKHGRGVCQDHIITKPDLSVLPVMQCWPHDGGRFITLPVVITHHPVTGIRNAGMYRMQVFDRDTTGMHWHMHKGGAAHYDKYKELGIKMPVAVVLGGDPIYTYVATAPLPDGIDEFIMAGFLRKKKVKMVRCITQDIDVPEDADIVIEGYIDPAEQLRTEGPFGDHTGVYSLADNYPVFHVTCITHRNNAVYPSTIVGVPPMEDRYLAQATEKIFLNPIRMMYDEVNDLHLPWFGVAHNLVLLKIKPKYPGHAFKIMYSMLGNGQMMFSKVIVCVNENFSFEETGKWLEIILSQVNIQDNVEIISGPADVLDHASYHFAYGGKMLVDATLCKEHGPAKKLSLKLETEDGFIISEYANCVICFVPDYCKMGLNEILSKKLNSYISDNTRVLVLADKEAVNLPSGLLAWYVLNNIDPKNDCVKLQNCLCVNARAKTGVDDGFKRDWPNIVSMDDKTIEKIDIKWQSIFSEGLIESPSVIYRKLVKGDGAKFIK